LIILQNIQDAILEFIYHLLHVVSCFNGRDCSFYMAYKYAALTCINAESGGFGYTCYRAFAYDVLRLPCSFFSHVSVRHIIIYYYTSGYMLDILDSCLGQVRELIMS